MAKQKFTIAHDVRIGGKHICAGSTVEINSASATDASFLRDLLASGRIKEVEQAHKLLAEPVQVESTAPKVSAPEKEKAPEAPKLEK